MTTDNSAKLAILRETIEDILKNGSIYHDVGSITVRLRDALRASSPEAPCQECVTLTQQYNTYVANGLIMNARNVARHLDVHQTTTHKK